MKGGRGGGRGGRAAATAEATGALVPCSAPAAAALLDAGPLGAAAAREVAQLREEEVVGAEEEDEDVWFVSEITAHRTRNGRLEYEVHWVPKGLKDFGCSWILASNLLADDDDPFVKEYMQAIRREHDGYFPVKGRIRDTVVPSACRRAQADARRRSNLERKKGAEARKRELGNGAPEPRAKRT